VLKRADEIETARQKVNNVIDNTLESLAFATLILCWLSPATNEQERHLGIVTVMYVRDPVSLCVELTRVMSFAEDELMVTSN
jgi:hypothetical protein